MIAKKKITDYIVFIFLICFVFLGACVAVSFYINTSMSNRPLQLPASRASITALCDRIIKLGLRTLKNKRYSSNVTIGKCTMAIHDTSASGLGVVIV